MEGSCQHVLLVLLFVSAKHIYLSISLTSSMLCDCVNSSHKFRKEEEERRGEAGEEQEEANRSKVKERSHGDGDVM